MSKERTKDISISTPIGDFHFYNPDTYEEIKTGESIISINEEEGSYLLIPFQELNEESFKHCITAIVISGRGISALIFTVVNNEEGTMVLRPFFKRDGEELLVFKYADPQPNSLRKH
ncbi:hypothetical protein MOC16_gp356 [Klebsiella phage vB_KpM_FBKp24]|uniref:Uncharacterized protein n=1 Tax=Klebsiella phage vB_KpM_FBKp24 TaxID=2801834 RepID=A0A7U0GBT4_9CAUD|nr:hypothetical protein MOC16_gp356 [Klebsiella phage vB_KpM_FBKp24]QQV92273.1 hypothetical protein vBKpMFBKp24_057 [Klebsiella phage vB_KpM_FBKp24]